MADYSTFLENYLLNELFMNVYPWQLEGKITQNFAVFLTTYKVFELIVFSASLKNFTSKEDLLAIVDSFTRTIDHNSKLKEKILKQIKEHGIFFMLPENLIEQ